MRSAFLEAATSAARLLAEPAVAAAWERPSALAKLSVSGLAGHLLTRCGPDSLANRPTGSSTYPGDPGR